MQSCELRLGRAIGIVLEPGDEVLEGIARACSSNGVRQGFITTFSGAFRSLRLIAAAVPPVDEEVPLGEETTISYAEGVGSGTVTTGTDDEPSVHLHIAAGVKGRRGEAHAGHLLGGEVHYVTEILLLEVVAPELLRLPDPRAYGLPRLSFG